MENKMPDHTWKDAEKGMGARKIKVAKAPPTLKELAARKKTRKAAPKAAPKAASKTAHPKPATRKSAAPKKAPKATSKKTTAKKANTLRSPERKASSQSVSPRNSALAKPPSAKRRGTGRTGSISAPKTVSEAKTLIERLSDWVDRNTKGGHSASNSVRKKAGVTGSVKKGPQPKRFF
jgi:hypothetical protein